MEYSIDLGRLPQVAALYSRAPEIIERRLMAAMDESLLLLQRETAEATPTGAHQLLRKSIIAAPVRRLADEFIGEVAVADRSGQYGSVLNYAVPVELGTKPHMPPIEPLVDWVKAKFGQRGKQAKKTAEAIRWKIYRKGTEGAFMFKRSRGRLTPYIQARFERAAAEILAELGGV